MRLRSGSSLLVATLAVSSSLPCLGAPAGGHSYGSTGVIHDRDYPSPARERRMTVTDLEGRHRGGGLLGGIAGLVDGLPIVGDLLGKAIDTVGGAVCGEAAAEDVQDDNQTSFTDADWQTLQYQISMVSEIVAKATDDQNPPSTTPDSGTSDSITSTSTSTTPTSAPVVWELRISPNQDDTGSISSPTITTTESTTAISSSETSSNSAPTATPSPGLEGAQSSLEIKPLVNTQLSQPPNVNPDRGSVSFPATNSTTPVGPPAAPSPSPPTSPQVNAPQSNAPVSVPQAPGNGEPAIERGFRAPFHPFLSL